MLALSAIRYATNRQFAPPRRDANALQERSQEEGKQGKKLPTRQKEAQQRRGLNDAKKRKPLASFTNSHSAAPTPSRRRISFSDALWASPVSSCRARGVKFVNPTHGGFRRCLTLPFLVRAVAREDAFARAPPCASRELCTWVSVYPPPVSTVTAGPRRRGIAISFGRRWW